MANIKQTYHQLKSDLVNVKGALRLASALPRFFRERITLAQSEVEIKRLLDTRLERFLEIARLQIYERPDTPYLKLLKHAGCEYSDLEISVKRNGLEDTLAKLAGEGVYLTADEFKGKSAVTRGTMSFRVSPKDFYRSDSTAGYDIQSSGTRNQPVGTFSSLDWLALQVFGQAFFYSAHNLFSSAHAVYEPIVAGSMKFILTYAKLGIPTDKWFALNAGGFGLLEGRYHHMNARLIADLGRWFGPGIANPEYLEVGDVKPVLEWIREKKLNGQNSCIRTVVSNATRIARAALEAGMSLQDVTFTMGGEPLTESKYRVFEKAGARIALRYGPGGDSGTSLGCGNARFIDEMHVPESIISFVENPRDLNYGDTPIHPLMLTTLHLAAPRFLFNVENGDYASFINRDCGCPLEKIGFTQHVHTVRSFEKMTSEGMNYSGADLFELLEGAIPSEFGGAPGDYQLVEEEDDN
ncbi:MAG: hypothetical protein OEN50_13125, partial [Deltaproteobacteria bacterium]|nr:hypothetical protein [Deltaproteobacteria bacterium]